MKVENKKRKIFLADFDNLEYYHYFYQSIHIILTL